jgi:hypothetical protein
MRRNEWQHIQTSIPPTWLKSEITELNHYQNHEVTNVATGFSKTPATPALLVSFKTTPALRSHQGTKRQPWTRKVSVPYWRPRVRVVQKYPRYVWLHLQYSWLVDRRSPKMSHQVPLSHGTQTGCFFISSDSSLSDLWCKIFIQSGLSPPWIQLYAMHCTCLYTTKCQSPLESAASQSDTYSGLLCWCR